MKGEGTEPPPLPLPVSPPAHPARVWRGWLFGCGIALAAVVVLFYGWLRTGLEAYSLSLPNPERTSQLDRLEVERIALPPGWEKAQPWPSEVAHAFAAYLDGWRKWTSSSKVPILSINTRDLLDPLHDGEELSSAQWRGVESALLRGPQLEHEAAVLAALPGYGMEIFRDTMDPCCEYGDMWFAYQVPVKVLCLLALKQSHDASTSVALSTALDALAMTRRHPASEPLTHLLGIAGASCACRTLDTINRTTTSPQMLREALDRIQAMRPGVRHEVMGQAQFLVWTGDIRVMQRLGYAVALDPSKPAIETFDAWVHARAAFPQWLLARLKPDDPRREPTEMALKEAKTNKRLDWIASARQNPLTRPMKDSLLRIQARKFPLLDIGEAVRQELVSAALYDLACIGLASRVMELETGRCPASVSELVPAYIPEEPHDPFTGSPYPHDPASGRFYSPGPDGADDHATREYDPEKQTDSGADVMM
jgi:hypothetical protein